MKKTIRTLLISAVLLLTAAAGLFFWATHIRIGSHHYQRNAQMLDVRQDGLTVEEYLRLRTLLPECEILWNLTVDGTEYPLDTTQITVTSLTMEDVENLDLLPALKQVDARQCPDPAAAIALAQRRPECRVLYQVTIGGTAYENTVRKLTITDADPAELAEKLPLLSSVRTVTIEGALPPAEDLNGLRDSFPDIDFFWQVTYGDKTMSCSITELDLTDVAVENITELKALIRYLPLLDTVRLTGSGISQEEIMALADANPEVFFLWDMEAFGTVFPTDAEEIDLSGIPVESEEDVEALLPYLPRLKKVIMCGCGVPNELMEALDQRHEDVRFIWSVQVGWRMLRTDITWFMPYKLDLVVTDADVVNLRYCHDIECVDVGHMPLTNCEWAAYMPKLRYLIIGDTGITDISPLKGLTNLIFLEMFKTGITDYAPLLTLTALEDLNLGYTYGDAEIIAKMTWLKNLWWHRPWPPWGGPESETRLALPEILKDTNVNINYTSGSTDEGWRHLPNYYAQRDFLGMFYMDG